MLTKLSDLRFVIGLFLSVLGCLVLATFALGGTQEVAGIAVNLLGGSLLLIVGLLMIAGSLMDRK